MISKSPTQSVIPDLQDQRVYVEKVHNSNFDFSLMVADAFVRGIRDIGYKDSAYACFEFVDNSLQAGAENVHIVFGYDDKSNKPSKLAIFDDGHGMDPEMIRLAIIWGGTHRQNDRKGFGRYGYGLPSAAVSQGRRFYVYSLVEGGVWYRNGLDLDDLANGVYSDNSGRVTVPPSTTAELPSWLQPYTSTFFKSGYKHGTIVVIEKLDKLTWTTQNGLETNLLEKLGITYRNFLTQRTITVNGKKIEPTDPLFLTPGFRFYDENEIHPDAPEPITFDVKDSESRKVLGTIKVRFAYFPPTFTKENPKDPLSKALNKRFQILKAHRGIIILRNGRQIEVVPPNDWFSLESNDVYWKVEVDFPPHLDEEFSITTSKQTVRLSDRIWDHLEKAGVRNAISEMRKRYKQDKNALDAKKEDSDLRASERAMEEAEKFKTTPGPSIDQIERAEKRKEEEIKKRTEITGKPVDEVRKEVEIELKGHPYKVLRESLPGAPFYRVEQIGGQKVLFLNIAHGFYSKIYWSADATPYFRAALETLLFVIGECELDSTGERRNFYETERVQWSTHLSVALGKLESFIDDSTKRGTEEPEMALDKGQPKLI